MHVQILPQTVISRTRTLTCFNKRTLSPSHTPLLSLSVTDVYTLISNCASTCAIQKFLHVYTIINIYKTQSHIHSQSDVFIVAHPHIHTSALPAQKHISQLITSPHAVLSHGVTYQTFTELHGDALLSLQQWMGNKD